MSCVPRWRCRPARVALACLLLAGCFGGSARVRHYAMTPIARPEAGVSTGLREIALAVGPLDLPRVLDRPQIVERAGENGFTYHDADRWGGSLESDFLRVLTDDLATLLGTSRVVSYPTEASFALDYRVRLDVQQFDGRRGEDVRLRVRWVVAPGDGGEALAVEQSTIREPVADSSFESLVAAHSAAVAQLGRDIASRVVELGSAKAAGNRAP
jgi:uncharacterized lipoprotein YmbA